MPFLQGESLFNDEYRVKSDKRDNFHVEMATLVGGAWKLKKINPQPFGIHTAVVDSWGKLIRENEETGSRYFYFAKGDLLEKRISISKSEILKDKRLLKLYNMLPKEP